MPNGGEQQLTRTGLARLQQVQRPGYVSAADRRLIQEGLNIGGGYVELNGQVLVDEPDQRIELSDPGKAYLAWRGTDPRLAAVEAEQASVRSNQKEVLARNAAEGALQAARGEVQKGLMSMGEYAQMEKRILQDFGSSKAPSPLDYLSTVQDKNDPDMQETRYKDNVKHTLAQMYGDQLDPDMANAVAGMTQRNKDGQLENPFALKLLEGKINEQVQSAATRKDQLNRSLGSLDTQFGSIESPTPEQRYGYQIKRNRVLEQFGQPTEELPPMVQTGNWLTGYGQGPQDVADNFAAETERLVSGGDHGEQPKQVFSPSRSGPIRVETKEQVRAELMKARSSGLRSIKVIGPDGVVQTVPVPK
jgi:hypothetical protein